MRLAILLLLALSGFPARAQPAGDAELSLYALFNLADRRQPLTAWERWLRNPPPPKVLLARRPEPGPGFTEPMQTPSTPEDNPFASQLTLLDEGQIRLGVSGGRGFNLRNIPQSLPQWISLLRLRNLFRLHEWIQPESNELRLQNLIGASFHFYF